MELSELLAREQIRHLVASYAHLADSGRFEALVALFAVDAILHAGEEPEVRGHVELRQFFGRTNDSLAAATTRPYIRHHVSNHWIEMVGDDRAEGQCYFFVVTERGPDHWGRYKDRYVCENGVWRFSYRRARMDGYTPTSWVAERRRPKG